jgi:hypothetical protein
MQSIKRQKIYVASRISVKGMGMGMGRHGMSDALNANCGGQVADVNFKGKFLW